MGKKGSESEKNILQMIVEGANRSDLSEDEIDTFVVDNCKNICFVAYEGAVPAIWTLMLLALYPEWQDKVRAEALEICNGQSPSSGMLNKMKTLTMVIYESLRLYPLGSMLTREAFQDMKFGSIEVPKKGMVKLMLESAVSVINEWNREMESAGGVADIKINEHLWNFSGQVISKACLGRNCKEIILKLRALQEITCKKVILQGIPRLR
ncbi:hypothetical protein V6N13_091794 [Hibiscus sabdariffa]|uniref:Cytochrome P450 n=1 Tax=Hibiscus sabdariffa TaxID=183260 RepID=A0ABR2QF31_9ROSI